jgi:hypothetical protein
LVSRRRDLARHATTPTAAMAMSVLVANGPKLAFTFGPSPFAVEYGDGDGVFAAPNTLSILGVTYRKTPA